MIHRRSKLICTATLLCAIWSVAAWNFAEAQADKPPAADRETRPAMDTPAGSTTPDAEPPTPADADAAYTRVITERAEKLIATLDIADADQKTRLRDLFVKHYRALRGIHDELAAKTAEATKPPASDPTVLNAWLGVARVQTGVKLQQLHRYFVARLAAELTAEQVDKVKDGMTYGVVPVTYKRYQEMLPNLTADQQREILANLFEAREYAMDAGSSEEKHQIFGQYKGRINNYLSQAGYDLKQAERDLAARQKAAARDNSQ